MLKVSTLIFMVTVGVTEPGAVHFELCPGINESQHNAYH